MKTYSQHLSGTGQTSRVDIIRKPVLRSSAIFPYLINNKIDNKFLLLGYWLLKRNIKEILLLITIRSKDGKIIFRNKEIINEIKAYNFSLKKMLKYKKGSLTGSIEFEVFSTQDLYYPYPACVLEASSKDCSTFVHTCGRVYNDFEDLKNNSSFKPPESGFDILPNKNVKHFFSFVNGSTRIKNESLKIKLINHRGKIRKKQIQIRDLKPYETKHVFFTTSLDKKFFANKKGTAKIYHNFKSFFPRFLVGNISSDLSKTTLTHTYYDISDLKEKDHFWKNPNRNIFYDSIITFPLFFKQNYNTELGIYPIQPIIHDVYFNMQIFNSKGKKLNELKNVFKISKNFKKPFYLNINNVIEKNNIMLNEKINYYIKIVVDSKMTPARLKFGYNISNKNKFNFPSNVCFNAVVPNMSMLNKKRTFKWAPIINKKDSKIIVTNFSTLRKNFKNANVEIKFWREKDNKFISKKLIINDNGSYWFELNKEKKVKNFLKNKSGWITITGDSPFLSGFTVEDSKTGILGADHVF
tara:strand:+ start:6969 stop:8540 length:1572 start_codon:yes stop_codon:yes gene_type:complete